MCAPYQWTKQVASHWGGTRNGTIVHWPNGFADKGTTRNQFHHVIDVAPTILEAAGLPTGGGQRYRRRRRWRASACCRCCATAMRPRRTLSSTSRCSATAASTTRAGPRSPNTAPRGQTDTPPPFDNDVWELYGPDDWTQAHNLAAENPKKLAELQRLWLIEAVKYNVVPLDDRTFERFNPDLAGRPQLIRGNSQLLFPGMRVSENCVVNMKNKSHSVTANITVPDAGATGVIITQGGVVGGWTLYAHEGKLKYCYNFFGIKHYIDHRRQADPGRKASGAHGVRLRRRRPGQGRRRHPVLRRRGGRHRAGGADSAMVFSADEACDVGADTGSPASPDYGPTGNKFTGEIDWVQIDLGDDSHDHLIKPEDRINMAMARQ